MNAAHARDCARLVRYTGCNPYGTHYFYDGAAKAGADITKGAADAVAWLATRASARIERLRGVK